MADQTSADPARPEQRAYPRLPLQKNLLLIARGMNQRACQMKDICAGGALVELLDAGAENRALRRGEVVLLRLLLGEGEDARSHEMRARIAHADHQLFGVSFFNPDPESLASLLAAAATADQAERVPALSGPARELLDRLAQQVLSFCAGLFVPFFRNADAQLLAAAEHSGSVAEQRLFFEAATQLRRQQDDIRTRYLKELRQVFDQLEDGASHADLSGLSEAERERFEGWLAVKVMAARAEEKCRMPLQALQARLDELAGRRPNPFAPVALCVAFQKVMTELDFAPAIEKGLYRTFEESALSNLEGIYELLNHTLIQNDVLPQLAAAPAPAAPAMPAPPPPAPAASPERPPVAAPARTAARPEPPRNAAEFLERAGLPVPAPTPRPTLISLEALRELLMLQQEMQATDAVLPVPDFPADTTEVRRVFATLKAAATGWRPALEKLAQHAEGGGAARVVLALQPFAETLVQVLVQGGASAAWLQQLELPLLFVLAGDAGFFRDHGHPARQVLEHLARLGQKDVPLAAGQRQAIDQLLERLARDFDQDPQLFTQLLQELEPLAAWLEQSCQRNTDRVRQMAEGEQRLTVARQRVQEVLDARLAGRRVPQPVLTLLDAGWRDLLTTTLLRQGEDGQAWKDYLGLVDELLAIGADVHRKFDLRALLGLLKTGLQDANSRTQQQVVAGLKPLLAGAQRLLGDVDWVQMPARKPESESAEERWLQKWTERAQRLQSGDWLELKHRGSDPERQRLAWRDAAGSRFVFVNRQGTRAGDLSLQELATLMHAGHALGCAGEVLSPVDEALEKAGYRLYEQLAFRATHDPLTGLANRAEFLRQVDRALDAAKRHRAHHVLACISLDQFGDINNTAKAVAEQLLRSVAHLLGKALAPRTLVARLGDDEFGLLLEDCELGKAQQLFSLRLGELAAMRLSFEGEIYKLTASAGLVDIAYTSDTAAQLLRAAGDACAEARRHGGNRIEVYQPTAEEQARRDAVVVWVAKLNQALEEERLALRCQRIQPLAATAAPGMEILLGMHSDGIEDLPPSEFVQAAERYNRMLAVDRWVVENTFRWLKDNPDKLAQLGLVSINLSVHSLSDAQTMSFLFDRLLAYKLPPEKLCFEITEAAAIGHLADAADLMHELHNIGCRFALDDFGTAHASCDHLRHLPLDFVKIDGAFVRGLAPEARDGTMVRAINALAHYAGLQTIAEFVEDDAIRQQLLALGVDYAQGYGIEKPRWLDSL